MSINRYQKEDASGVYLLEDGSALLNEDSTVLVAGADAGTASDSASVAQVKATSDAGVAVDGGAGGGTTTVGQDSFTEAGSGTAALTTHTAETGGTWATWFDDSGGTVSILIDKTNDRFASDGALWAGGDVIHKLGTVSVGDGDVYVTTGPAGTYQPYVAARILGTNNAYVVQLQAGSTSYLFRLTAGAFTVVGSADTSGLSRPMRARLNVAGSSPTTLKARFWNTGGSEPGTWDISTSDSTAGNNSASSGAVGVGGSQTYDPDYGDAFPFGGDDFLATADGGGGGATVSASLAGTDAGSAVDAVAGRAFGLVDAGAATDTAAEAAAFASTDAASATDTATVTIGAVVVNATESAAATDTAGVVASFTTTDAGAGAETSAPAAVETATESAAATDSAALAAALAGTEAGTGTDTASLALAIASADAGAGAETASMVAAAGAVDSATGSDVAAAPTVALARSDAATASDTASPAAAYTSTDAGAATETSTVLVGVTLVNAADSATASETATIAALYASTDTGAGAELAVLASAYVVTDAAAAADPSALGTLLARTEAAIASEAARAELVPDTVRGFAAASERLAASAAGSDAGARATGLDILVMTTAVAEAAWTATGGDRLVDSATGSDA